MESVAGVSATVALNVSHHPSSHSQTHRGERTKLWPPPPSPAAADAAAPPNMKECLSHPQINVICRDQPHWKPGGVKQKVNLNQILSWWTKHWPHPINIWDTVTNVVPLRSSYQPSYEPSLILLAPFFTLLAHLIMLFIIEISSADYLENT